MKERNFQGGKNRGALFALVKRNIKLFFKDKGMFFTSLITPIILLVLYATFLYNVYKDSFSSALGGFPVEESLLNGLVGGLLLSSLLAVSTVTVSFCANLFMVQDKITGARGDFDVSPTGAHILSASYYIATAVNALVISVCATLAGLVYLACTGWYLSFADVLALFGDVVLLVAFGTALSSLVCYPLTSQGQLSAVGTVVSAGYGFVCGAYMPISTFSEGLRNALAFFPGTYGTSLLRNHALQGVLSKMQGAGVPEPALAAVKDVADCNLYVFGAKIEPWVSLLVVGASVLVLVLGYLLLTFLSSKRKTGAGENGVKSEQNRKKC